MTSTNPEQEWPPSLEHIVFHEAGHAVLQNAYGLTATIRVEANALDGGKTWGEDHAARAYCESILEGKPPSDPLPTEEQLGEVLSIYLAGEAAYHIWRRTPDDMEAVVENWQPDRHQFLVDTDRRHRETYLACKIATYFFYGDIERASDFVVQRQQAASEILQAKWYGVMALAAGVLASYWEKRVNRALQHSEMIDFGLLTVPQVTDLLQKALVHTV